jgi:hypothetical protein
MGISGLLNDESPTPYFYDAVHFDKLENERLKKDIEDFGKAVFENNYKWLY